jgi:hypothetical protein
MRTRVEEGLCLCVPLLVHHYLAIVDEDISTLRETALGALKRRGRLAQAPLPVQRHR